MCIPVKNTAANPVFWTELSEANSMRRTLPSDVTNGGSWFPQKTPCLRNSFSLSLLRTSIWSYSQSCCFHPIGQLTNFSNVE